MFHLKAEYRSTGGKAGRTREDGLVPGCLYGGGLPESQPLQRVYAHYILGLSKTAIP